MLKQILVGLGLAIAFVAASPSESAAQVAVVLTMEVPQGQIPAFLEAISKAEAVVKRVAPEAEVSVWTTVVGGPTPAAPQLRAVALYPSLEAWGAANDSLRTDPEFRAAGAEMLALGARIVHTQLTRNITP